MLIGSWPEPKLTSVAPTLMAVEFCICKFFGSPVPIHLTIDIVVHVQSDITSCFYSCYSSKMKKNFSSQLIHSVITPFLVPRKAGGSVGMIGSPSINHIFVHTQ